MTTKPCSRCGRDDVADIHTCVRKVEPMKCDRCGEEVNPESPSLHKVEDYRVHDTTCQPDAAFNCGVEIIEAYNGPHNAEASEEEIAARHIRKYGNVRFTEGALSLSDVTDAARAVVDRHRYLEAHSSDYDDGYMGPTIDALAALVTKGGGDEVERCRMSYCGHSKEAHREDGCHAGTSIGERCLCMKFYGGE